MPGQKKSVLSKGAAPAPESGDLRREFEARLPVWRQLRDEALFILERGLGLAAIKYHALNSRIKSFESFLAKKERKTLDNPFDQIRDVVGIRVVCLFLSDIQRVGDVVRRDFDVVEEDDKIEGQHVSSFGYMSFHFTAQIKGSFAGPRYDAILGIPFEIQVRTIAMDAWAATSHYLDYRTDSDVPSDLRRDFYALSGLFYVADRHFEMFFRSRQTVREEIERTLERPAPLLEQELNLDSLTAYLKSKFPDREHLNPEDVSVLLSELRGSGFRAISDVDALIKKHWDWFVPREKARPPVITSDPSGEARGPFADVGVVRIILRRETKGEEE
jgi:ppGpp synthetase/RelA/SpoT-type nucleotidyltranferase